jgi:hypothetical protein
MSLKLKIENNEKVVRSVTPFFDVPSNDLNKLIVELHYGINVAKEVPKAFGNPLLGELVKELGKRN